MKKSNIIRDKKYLASNLSADIIKLLCSKGLKLRDIAKLLALSPSFLSRVKNGQRSLTLSHLSYLEEGLGVPLPLILMEASESDSQSTKLKKLYDHCASLLKSVAEDLTGKSLECNAWDLYRLTIGHEVLPDVHKKNESQIIEFIDTFQAEAIKVLKKHPRAILSTTGHAFEKIIAEILSSLGFEDINLNVRTENGEVDILGFSRDNLGYKIGYVFELKQKGKSGKNVVLQEVTRLFALRESLKQKLGVHQGVFVTTTDYTRNAREFGDLWHLDLRKYEDIMDWIRQYELSGNGLYLKRN